MLVIAYFIATLAQAQGVPPPAIEVKFRSGDVQLAGSLWLPKGKGPHPVAVSLSGSGAVTRSDPFYNRDAVVFPKNGIGVFLFDKRGHGASSGKPVENDDLPTIVQDAVAAVKAMMSRPEVNPRAAGVKGVSQGGWASVMVAKEIPKLAFVVSVSGPGVDANRQTIHWMGRQLLAKGTPAKSVSLLNRLRGQLYDYYATGEGFKAIDKAWEKAKSEPWFTQVGLDPKAKVATPEKVRTSDFDRYRRKRFDMVSLVSRLKVPTLALFGENDPLLPFPESIDGWKKGIALGSLRNVTIKVFENAGHGIEFKPDKSIAMEHAGSEIKMAKGYDEFVFSWIRDHLRRANLVAPERGHLRGL